jgi:hypothetical protein
LLANERKDSVGVDLSAFVCSMAMALLADKSAPTVGCLPTNNSYTPQDRSTGVRAIQPLPYAARLLNTVQMPLPFGRPFAMLLSSSTFQREVRRCFPHLAIVTLFEFGQWGLIGAPPYVALPQTSEKVHALEPGEQYFHDQAEGEEHKLL